MHFDASLPTSGFDVCGILSDEKHYSSFICGECNKLVSLDSVVTNCCHAFCRKCLENVATASFMMQIPCECPICHRDIEDNISNASAMQIGSIKVSAQPLQGSQPLAYRVLSMVQVVCLHNNKEQCQWTGNYGDFLKHALTHSIVKDCSRHDRNIRMEQRTSNRDRLHHNDAELNQSISAFSTTSTIVTAASHLEHIPPANLRRSTSTDSTKQNRNRNYISSNSSVSSQGHQGPRVDNPPPSILTLSGSGNIHGEEDEEESHEEAFLSSAIQQKHMSISSSRTGSSNNLLLDHSQHSKYDRMDPREKSRIEPEQSSVHRHQSSMSSVSTNDESIHQSLHSTAGRSARDEPLWRSLHSTSTHSTTMKTKELRRSFVSSPLQSESDCSQVLDQFESSNFAFHGDDEVLKKRPESLGPDQDEAMQQSRLSVSTNSVKDEHMKQNSLGTVDTAASSLENNGSTTTKYSTGGGFEENNQTRISYDVKGQSEEYPAINSKDAINNNPPQNGINSGMQPPTLGHQRDNNFGRFENGNFVPPSRNDSTAENDGTVDDSVLPNISKDPQYTVVSPNLSVSAMRRMFEQKKNNQPAVPAQTTSTRNLYNNPFLQAQRTSTRNLTNNPIIQAQATSTRNLTNNPLIQAQATSTRCLNNNNSLLQTQATSMRCLNNNNNNNNQLLQTQASSTRCLSTNSQGQNEVMPQRTGYLETPQRNVFIESPSPVEKELPRHENSMTQNRTDDATLPPIRHDGFHQNSSKPINTQTGVTKVADNTDQSKSENTLTNGLQNYGNFHRIQAEENVSKESRGNEPVYSSREISQEHQSIEYKEKNYDSRSNEILLRKQNGEDATYIYSKLQNEEKRRFEPQMSERSLYDGRAESRSNERRQYSVDPEPNIDEGSTYRPEPSPAKKRANDPPEIRAEPVSRFGPAEAPEEYYVNNPQYNTYNSIDISSEHESQSRATYDSRNDPQEIEAFSQQTNMVSDSHGPHEMTSDYDANASQVAEDNGFENTSNERQEGKLEVSNLSSEVVTKEGSSADDQITITRSAEKMTETNISNECASSGPQEKTPESHQISPQERMNEKKSNDIDQRVQNSNGQNLQERVDEHEPPVVQAKTSENTLRVPREDKSYNSEEDEHEPKRITTESNLDKSREKVADTIPEDSGERQAEDDPSNLPRERDKQSDVDNNLKKPCSEEATEYDEYTIAEEEEEEEEVVVTEKDVQQEKRKRAVQRAEKLRKQANAKFNKGDFAVARKLYTQGIAAMKAIESKTTEQISLLSNMHSNRAVTYFREKRFEQCIQDCDEAIGYDPNSDKTWIRKWRGLMALGKFDEALSFIRQATKEIPKSKKLQDEFKKCKSEKDTLTEAQSMMGKGEIKQTKQLLDRMIGSCDNVVLLTFSARVDITLGDTTSALEKLNKGLKVNPGYIDCLELRGLAHFFSGDTETGAKSLYEASSKHKDNTKLRDSLANVQRTHAALTQARSAVKRSQYKDAIEQFTLAIKASEPLPPMALLFAILRTERGRCYVNILQYLPALKDCQQVIDYRREYAPAWVIRSEVLAALGKGEDAKKELSLARRTWGANDPELDAAYIRIDFESRLARVDQEIVTFQKELDSGRSERLPSNESDVTEKRTLMSNNSIQRKRASLESGNFVSTRNLIGAQPTRMSMMSMSRFSSVRDLSRSSGQKASLGNNSSHFVGGTPTIIEEKGNSLFDLDNDSTLNPASDRGNTSFASTASSNSSRNINQSGRRISGGERRRRDDRRPGSPRRISGGEGNGNERPRSPRRISGGEGNGNERPRSPRRTSGGEGNGNGNERNSRQFRNSRGGGDSRPSREDIGRRRVSRRQLG